MKLINVWTKVWTVFGLWNIAPTLGQGPMAMGGIGGASPSRGGKMTQKFINTILKLHNDYRRTEGASNMKKLVRFFFYVYLSNL